MHPIVRFQLLEIRSLNRGWWYLTFKDYINAFRYTKCQGYDNTKATCKAAAVVCVPKVFAWWKNALRKIMVDLICVSCVWVNTHHSQIKLKSKSQEWPVHLTWCKEVAKKTSYE